jgi:hypothetical protein
VARAKKNESGPGEEKPVRFRIETPVKIGRTTRFGLLFVNGISETDDEMVAQQCKSQGYMVEEVEAAA